MTRLFTRDHLIPAGIALGIALIAFGCLMLQSCATGALVTNPAPAVTTEPASNAAAPTPSPSLNPALAPEWSMGAKIDAIVVSSPECSLYKWKDRGRAPMGFMKGVARTFGRAVCGFKAGDAGPRLAAKAMDDVAESKRDRYDALSWYNSNFAKLGMQNLGGDLATLRHDYLLLLGLGPRESSGRYCCGRDASALNTSSSSAEAGAWQTSYDSHGFSPELSKLFARYQAAGHPDCILPVFKEGASCSAADLKTWGSGVGATFQELEKSCPAFAAEYAAIMLRVSGGNLGHYGPLRNKAAEIIPACEHMLSQVEELVDAQGCAGIL